MKRYLQILLGMCLLTVAFILFTPLLGGDTGIFEIIASMLFFPITVVGALISFPDNENVFLGIFLIFVNAAIWSGIVWSALRLFSLMRSRLPRLRR